MYTAVITLTEGSYQKAPLQEDITLDQVIRHIPKIEPFNEIDVLQIPHKS